MEQTKTPDQRKKAEDMIYRRVGGIKRDLEKMGYRVGYLTMNIMMDGTIMFNNARWEGGEDENQEIDGYYPLKKEGEKK